MTVKKKVLMPIIVILALAASLVALIMLLKPYKVITFIADGDQYSAEVEEDGTMILNVNNGEKSGEWTIVTIPEIFAPNSFSNTDAGAEFHILPKQEGKGHMVIRFTADDGTTEDYSLTLIISRHKRKYMQIDSIVFLQYENEADEARQVLDEYCLDNGYKLKYAELLESRDKNYVFQLAASKQNEPHEIKLTVRKLDDGSWEVADQYILN